MFYQCIYNLFLVGLLFLTGSSVNAQNIRPDQTKQIDSLFAKWNHKDSPGCILAVMKDGHIIYKRAYGMANLDYDVLLTTDTPIHVASISKQFTAAAIVLLEQEGKLSFDDDVRKYIPELPDFGEKITIRHLLHHTSGLRDQWNLLTLAGWRYSQDLITNEDVMSLVTRQKDLNFAPGAEQAYSNTGYTLLGEIVKRVSGKSLREFTTERIFIPLGMKSTHFRDNYAEIIKHQAYGYTKNEKGWGLSVTNFDTVGATGLTTTVSDLALWDENFYTGKIGGQHFTETMLHQDPLKNGETNSYAFGLMKGKYRGLDTIDHSGEDAGYRADLLRFPAQHFSVACLCNNGGDANPMFLAKKVTDILLADKLQKNQAEEKFLTLKPEQLRSKTGYYQDKKNAREILHLVMKNNNLNAKYGDALIPLQANSEEKFKLGDFGVKFNFAPGTKGLFNLKVGTPGEKMTEYEQLPIFNLPDSQLKDYVGDYKSKEIDSVYCITIEKRRLVLKRLKFQTDTLEAVAPDLFTANVGTIRFQRDMNKNLTGMLLTKENDRNLQFTRDLIPQDPQIK